MSLSDRIAGLAARIGVEVGTKVTAAHPALARAWVSFGYVAGQTVIHHSYGVASVERLAAGQYRITFATPMVDANYCWLALARSVSSSGSQRLAITPTAADGRAAGYIDVRCVSSLAGSPADSTEVNVVVYR
ncbi:MAG: hypothetical protein IH616_13880 [Gemmatimonadales bacterium]|jgi:hypothetical protein|nr:hypothetical protein [Gemmatimonadales bacterium]